MPTLSFRHRIASDRPTAVPASAASPVPSRHTQDGQQPKPTSRRRGLATWQVVAALVLVVGALVGGVVAYKAIKTNSQPKPVVKTEAEWQETLMALGERLNAANRETGRNIGPLIQEIKQLAEESELKGPGYKLLGQSYLMTSNHQKAFDAFTQSLKHESGSSDLEALAATAAYKLGSVDPSYYPQAVAHYEKALELKPDDAELRLFLAESLIARKEPGDQDRALFLLTEALGLDDSLHAAYFRLSGLRLTNNDADGAMDAIKKALERVDRHADEEAEDAYWRYQEQLAKVLMRQREYALALRVLLQHPDKDNEPLLGMQAACHAQLGEPEKAAAKYELLTIGQALPDANLLERAAHWWLQADQLQRARPLIQTYASHPDHDSVKLASLEKRMLALQKNQPPAPEATNG